MARTKDISKRPSSGSAQDNFLGELIKSGSEVELYISNGTKLRGAIASYDQYSISMSGVGGMVYKQAICLIKPLPVGDRFTTADVPSDREAKKAPPVIIKKRRSFTR